MSEPIPLGPGQPTRAELREVERLCHEHAMDATRMQAQLESLVADAVERPFAIAFDGCSAALGAALSALGATAGADVVLPALAPPALGAALVRSGARACYADVDAKSLTLTATHASARLTSATRVIVGAANHGQPAGLDSLAALASRNELPLLEFVCGGLGGRIGRDPVGRFGRIAVIALSERESPIGCGGAVCVTNDDLLAGALRTMRSGGEPEPRNDWERIGGIRPIERVGFDSRMGLLRAALGVSRLSRLDRTSEALEQVFHGYLRRLAMHPDLVLPAPCTDGMVRWSHFAIRLSERYSRDDRDSIVSGMLRHDIAATSVVRALPLEPAFANGHGAGDFPVAERAADRLIALPYSASLGERDIDLICQTLQVMIERQSILR
ncbi:MAG: DegT/DnrJ/EryC1/StrS family aminotransferase [Planctomycetota bacterium]